MKYSSSSKPFNKPSETKFRNYLDLLSSPASNYSESDASNDKNDEVYLDKLAEILSAGACLGVPTEPTNIFGNIYLGRSSEAENPDLIKRMNFTHLLNCGAAKKVLRKSRGNPHGPESGIKGYEELYLYDGEEEDLYPHILKAHQFLDSASPGKVLVYDSGVSRSGAIMLSYMMKMGFPLLRSAKILKNKRRVALCNTGFMKQLVKFAREREMLDQNVEKISISKFGGPRDKHRLRFAHLPMFF